MDPHRHERVGEEIAHEINAMLAGELKDPRLEGNVCVSEVRVQPDMKHARVFVSVRTENSKEQADAIKALEHASGFIRHELIERLQLRRLPDLHFTLDLSQEHMERIERLLKQMKAEKVEKPSKPDAKP
jgi:ribosome-binding factor A